MGHRTNNRLSGVIQTQGKGINGNFETIEEKTFSTSEKESICPTLQDSKQRAGNLRYKYAASIFTG